MFCIWGGGKNIIQLEKYSILVGLIFLVFRLWNQRGSLFLATES